MLAIQKSKSHKGECTPNVLPCRIHHNGPVNTSKRYWSPRKDADGKTIAYFRGRKLHGKAMKIPKGYRGVVLSTTDKILPKPQSKEHDEEDEEEFNEVKVVDEEATFDEFMVWGHEALPEEMADPYVRGMEEWIDFAKTIHAHDDEELDVGVGGKAK